MTAELAHLQDRRARWGFAAGGLRLALSAPGLISRCRGAALPGRLASVCLAVALLLASRLALRTPAGLETGVAPYLLLGVPALILAASAIAGARGPTFGAGVNAALWTVAAGTLLMFAVGTVEPFHWHHRYGRPPHLRRRAELPARQTPDDFTWGLLVLPLWWLPFGVLGAALGRRLRASSSRAQVVT